MKRKTNWRNVKWFAKSEWYDDPNKVEPPLVYALDELRERSKTPIIIHQAWADGGRSPGSLHYHGLSVDFHFRPGLSHVEELGFILASGFGEHGIGFYPEWHPRAGWHLDLRGFVGMDPLMWVRTCAKDYQYDRPSQSTGLLLRYAWGMSDLPQ